MDIRERKVIPFRARRTTEAKIIPIRPSVHFFDESEALVFNADRASFTSRKINIDQIGVAQFHGLIFDDSYLVCPEWQRAVSFVNGSIIWDSRRSVQGYGSLWEVGIAVDYEDVAKKIVCQVDVGKTGLFLESPVEPSSDGDWGQTSNWKITGDTRGGRYWFFAPAVARDLSKLRFSFRVAK